MPMTFKPYKGFKLAAAVYAADKGFLPILTITKDRGHQILDKQFTPPHPPGGYATDKEAVDATLRYGAAVIDGNVPGQSVDEM
jgi:hypothetical protein